MEVAKCTRCYPRTSMAFEINAYSARRYCISMEFNILPSHPESSRFLRRFPIIFVDDATRRSCLLDVDLLATTAIVVLENYANRCKRCLLPMLRNVRRAGAKWVGTDMEGITFKSATNNMRICIVVERLSAYRSPNYFV